MILPFMILPFVSRILTKSNWGEVVALQSLAAVASIIIEYGFNMSATREVSTSQGDSIKNSKTAQEVFSARILLSFLCLVLFCVYGRFSQHGNLLWLAYISAVAQGFSPIWYFQGVEKLRQFAVLDSSMKVISNILIFIFIRGENDGWKILILQGLFIGLGQIINHLLMYKEIVFLRPSLLSAKLGIIHGFSLFIFRFSVTLYTSSNAFLLQFFVPSKLVADYGNAEKLVNLTRFFVPPAAQLVYPRVSIMLAKDKNAAKRFLSKIIISFFLFSCVISVVFLFFSSLIIPLWLGQKYISAIPIFKVLCLASPIIAISNFIGPSWLLNLNKDKEFNSIIFFAGLTNILEILFFVPKYGIIGMAYSVLTCELIVTFGMLVLFCKTSFNNE